MNQRKLDVVEALEKLAADGGMTLIELALRFVLAHRTVTSAIIGPRTMAQLTSQLSAPKRELTYELLDAIDDLVAPGELINPVDGGYVAPALKNPVFRRRTF